MKLIVVPILILLVATQAFSKWAMLLEFKWNQDYIAQNLCENKAKPQLQCEGKCQLTKMMAEEQKETAPFQNKLPKVNLTEILFPSAFINVNFSLVSHHQRFLSPSNQFWKHHISIDSIFHPPAA